jgi:hypothetical protein
LVYLLIIWHKQENTVDFLVNEVICMQKLLQKLPQWNM